MVQVQPALAGSASIATLLARIKPYRTAVAAHPQKRNAQPFLRRRGRTARHSNAGLWATDFGLQFTGRKFLLDGMDQQEPDDKHHHGGQGVNPERLREWCAEMRKDEGQGYSWRVGTDSGGMTH